MYQREEKWEFRYICKNSEGKETEKVVYPRSHEVLKSNRKICRERGYRVISVQKLYPFNAERNQHNFMLISNICSNRIHDMINGDLPYDLAEHERLEEMKRKADELFELPLPIAWIPYETLQAAKELSEIANNYRMERCIERGRPDLIQYCC